MQIPAWVAAVRHQWDSWAQQQRASFNPQGWPPWHWKLRLPWHEDQKRKEALQEEYRKRKTQIQDLCQAVKAEDTEDLQDLLGALVLAECVYKRPEAEMIRAINSLRGDFGGQLVPLYRVQATLDHVPHRYLLAEGGDTLFAAFAGTKQYRDFITDANFLQGAMFHDDENESELKDEEVELAVGPGNDMSTMSNVKPKLTGLKPAAHRGFLARAKGIPAVELYRLAQKKDCKLVLCGHSLGGAVAVLTTLAILRVFATASLAKAGGKLQIKCITFSQPPVGNAALRDYVNQNGWQDHFRTYCIPEDVIPRILSPAYFQHYRSQVAKRISEVVGAGPTTALEASKDSVNPLVGKGASNPSSNDTENNNRMVLGVGPIPKHLWRLPKLVPINGPLRPFPWFKDRSVDSVTDGSEDVKLDSKVRVTPLEIQENGESVVLTPVKPASNEKDHSSERNEELSPGGNDGGNGQESLERTDLGSTTSLQESKDGQGGNGSEWLKRVPSVSVPSLPSYVPFGKLFFLERLFVTPLSASEYTELSSVQSVFQELKAGFRSHTMRSYRGRFIRIFNSCMSDGPSTSWTIEHLSHLPNLQSWLGILGAREVEAGEIADPVVLRASTTIIPLGWTGLPGDKPGRSLSVDIHGYGLHHCTLVRAQVNGHWCSTTVDIVPPRAFPDHELQQVQPKLQKMRVRIGPPIDSGPDRKPGADDSQEASTESAESSQTGSQSLSEKIELPKVGNNNLGICDGKGLGEVTIECSSDFMTTSQDVVARLRRVRLLGLEGAGKTSLYFALLGGDGRTLTSSDGDVLPDMDLREGVANGINYVDTAGVNLQDLAHETEQLRQEVRLHGGTNGKKLDLVILVHNLAHKVPRLHGGDSRPKRPALSVLLDEITAAGIPVVLAITNKFAVSADRRHLAASTIMNSYRVPSNLTVVVNSCPYSVHGLSNESLDALAPELESKSKGPVANGIVQGAAQRLFFGPMRLVPRPFGRREVILPVEGVNRLNSLVETILLSNEEAAFEDHAKEQLVLQTAEDLVQRAKGSARFGIGKPGAAGAAAVGAAFGAGFGVVVAVAVGASRALRKP